MKLKFFSIMIMILLSLTLVGCTQSIKEIKNPEYTGKKVTVTGKVAMPIKLGKLSGYTLIDSNNDTIIVSSQDLPKEGERVTVRGTLIKDTLFGYYIDHK